MAYAGKLATQDLIAARAVVEKSQRVVGSLT
jgi:hypothetical protein